MAFNKKKFLEALLDITATQSPVMSPARKPLAPTFAKFMAAKTYGASDMTDASIVGAENTATEDATREEGALSKTFGWLMSSGRQVQNSIMALTDDDLDASEKIAQLGKNWAAAGAHWAQPVAELLAIPGVDVPWEPEALSEFIQKHNTEYRGTGPISGTRLAEERFGLPEPKPGDKSDLWRNAGIGFGIDVLTDPLTYIGVGIPSKIKAASEIPKAIQATGSAKAFVKPETPTISQSLLQRFATPNLEVPRRSNEALAEKLRLPVTDPKLVQQVKMSRLSDYRWYEKLHPVQFTAKAVPKNPQFASYEVIGTQAVDALGEFTAEAARAIPRAEQGLLFNMVASKAGDAALSTAAQRKYLMKGAEDALESRGYTFPEGKLSEYLHSVKDPSKANIDTFVKGQPLKVRPMDASMEFKLAQAGKAKSRELLEAKLAKRSPGAVLSAHGINSRVVSQAIDHVAENVDEVTYLIPKTMDAAQTKRAIDVAEDFKSGLSGKMGPTDQARLYKKLYDATKSMVPERFGGVLESVGAAKWRRQTSLHMLKTAEEHLSKNYALRGLAWDGNRLSLTHAIEQLGPDALDSEIEKVLGAFAGTLDDDFTKAVLAKAMAKNFMKDGAVAKVILDDYVDTARIMERTVSHQKFLEWKETVAFKKAKLAAGAAGLSEKGAARVLDLVKNDINTEGLAAMEPMQMLDEIGKRAMDSIMNGTTDHLLIARIGKAIEESMGDLPRFLRHDNSAKNAVERVLFRMTTWYGRGDMIHAVRSQYSYIEDWAKARAAWFNNIAKSHTPDDIMTAFKYAQGHFTNIEKGMAEHGVQKSIVAPHIEELGKKFQDYFENIMSSTRAINDPAKLKGSVAVRAQIMMDDINKALKATNTNFQFTGKARTTKNIAGNPAGQGLGYGGDHWMLSWENVDPTQLGQDPLHFMYDLSLAVDRVTTEYAVIDDFVRIFGRRVTDPDFVPTMSKTLPHHRAAKDIYFEPRVADEFMTLLRDMEKGAWFPEAKFLRQVVKGQRLWKTGVTQYNPSFHIRNLIGDTWLMWMAGHNNPLMFRYASKMIAANRARYNEALRDPELDTLMGFMSREEYGLMHSKDTDIILRKHGADLTSAEIYGEALQRGLLLDASRASDIIGDPLFKNVHGSSPNLLKRRLYEPLGGHAHAGVMGLTEVREHFVRLAHFTSVVNKNLTPARAARLKKIASDPKIANKVAERRKVLEEVYEGAAREVRKWHPDGRDLSYFEQKYFRSVAIPFYSWQRKIIPLLIEASALRGGKVTMYPKGMFALQQAMGIESPSASDPFPTDRLYPEWMRNLGIGPIGEAGSDNPAADWFGRLGRNAMVGGEESGYTVINPGNPFNDTVAQFGAGGQSVPDSMLKASSIITPYFNVPKEFFSDTKWTGAPISKENGGQGYLNWLLSQTPVLSTGNRIANVGAAPSEGVEQQRPDTEALINILTALGIKGTGQYDKSAEFEKKYGIGYTK